MTCVSYVLFAFDEIKFVFQKFGLDRDFQVLQLSAQSKTIFFRLGQTKRKAQLLVLNTTDFHSSHAKAFSCWAGGLDVVRLAGIPDGHPLPSPRWGETNYP